MIYISSLGLLGTFIGLIRALPQLIRIIRSKEARGLSLDSVATSSIVSFGWALYGFLTNQIYVSLATGISGIIFAIIAIMAILYGRNIKELKIAPLWLGILFLSFFLYRSAGLGFVLPVSVLASNIPQLWIAYHERDLSDLSLGTWVLSFMDGLVWTIYSLMQNDTSILAFGIFNLLSSFPIIFLKLLFIFKIKNISKV
ncbi:MAG: hypothetical protein HN392_10440 [Anaerolineae bacterium]|jgi:uncharacterized protein with PQ loop repeat|nr:hypothetical protein [Anaerolineae bacterium]MBT7075350.1 hypothetical protein [Anaerolineae bacterium]